MKRIVFVVIFTCAALLTSMQHVRAKTTIGLLSSYGPSTLYSGLVGYWSFDGKKTHWTSSTAATTDDVSLHGNTATLTGMNIVTASTGGVSGQGLNFDGVLADMQASTTGLSTVNTATVSFWGKFSSFQRSNIQTIMADHDIVMEIDNNSHGDCSDGPPRLVLLAFKSDFSANHDGCFAPPTTNVWHHYVAIFNKSANPYTVSLYIDGILQSPASQINNGTQSVENFTATSANIGGGGSGQPITGSLDDLRVYNRALSAAEAKQLYNDTQSSKVATSKTLPPSGSSLNSGLVGYWTFDGKNTHWTSSTAATTDDVSMNGNVGTLANSSISGTSIQGKIGQAVHFDGSSYVSLGSALSTQVSTLPVSVAFWIKKDSAYSSATGFEYISVDGNWDSSGSAYSGFSVGDDGSGGIEIDYGDALGGGSSHRRSKASTNIGQLKPNVWYHIVAVYRGSTDMSIYVNGVDDGGSYSGTGGTYAVGSGGGNHTYTTSFPGTENPISESGNWLNGATNGVNWTDVQTGANLTNGHQFAHASAHPSDPFADATAILTGTWGANQTAQATVLDVLSPTQALSDYDEIELRLHNTLTAGSISGYEIFFSLRTDSSGYCAISRWNGPIDNFTSLATTQCNIFDGDVIKATIVGNVITGYINGIQKVQATDSTFTSGNPGIGFDGSDIGNYGFTNYSATDGSSGSFIGTTLDTTPKFKGVIDDVRIYNRGLSAAEAKQLYLTGK